MDGTKIQAINYILTAIGICTTIFRVWDRVRHHRFGNDDIAAIVCTVFQILFLVDGNFYFRGSEGQSPGFRIAVHIIILILVQAITWISKLTLSLNLLRIVILPGKLRTLLVIVSFVFAIIWPMIGELNVWLCMREPIWYEIPQPMRSPGLASAITDIVTNVVADLILIISPIWHVWRIRLSQAEKIRASSVFSTSIIMTVVVVYHEYWVVRSDGKQEQLPAVMHAGILLIVANLSVIIPFVFRAITSRDSDSERARQALDRGPSSSAFMRSRTAVSMFNPPITINIRPDGMRPGDRDDLDESIKVILPMADTTPKSSSNLTSQSNSKGAQEDVV